MIKLYPTEIEAHQDGSLVFKVTAQDEFCAEVEFSTWLTAESWPEVSAAIQQALDMMQLGGGKR